MFVDITGVGEHGVVKDLSPDAYRQVPLNAWTDAMGVVFEEGVVRKAKGLEVYFNTQIEPSDVVFVPGVRMSHFVYAGPNRVYARNMEGEEGDITRTSGPYNGDRAHRWHLADFNGVAIFNNGIDPPQAWLDQSVLVPLVDLPHWPSDLTVRTLRPFKYHLVGLSVTRTGGRFPRMVKWSHTADPGSVPSSWDHTDPSVDAGEVVLAPGSDELIDCLPLGDTNIIYGEGSTWAMRYVGGMSVFAFAQVSNTAGIIAQGAVADIGTAHFVVTDSDIVLVTSGGVQSIATPRVRNWFFRMLSSEHRDLVRVVPFRAAREVWVLFPTSGSVLNMALVWNWAYNTWSIRSLPNVVAGDMVTIARSQTDLWDGDQQTKWDDETEEGWNIEPITLREFAGTIVLACTDRAVRRPSVQGERYSMLERKWISIEPPPRVKMLLSIWPRMEAESVVELSVTVRGRMHLRDENGPVVRKSFSSSDKKVDVYVTGRFFDVKFEHAGTDHWTLHGYALELAEDLGWL